VTSQRVSSVLFVVLALTVWASGPALAADMYQGKVVEVGAGKLTMTDMDTIITNTKVDQLNKRIKEAVGVLTDDDSLKSEG
jgi:hypothetical protein